VRLVSAIDIDEHSIDIARKQDRSAEIDYLLGDFLTFPFQPASFDFVVCVAAPHHMDAAAALRHMRELLRTGGAHSPSSDCRAAATRSTCPATPQQQSPAAHTGCSSAIGNPQPQLWPPAQTFPEIRALAEPLLPGASIRRHLLWRYSVIWTKPAADAIA
jgi:SAM-dependent methyltransferase